MYRYYCLLRQAGPGAIPSEAGGCEIHNFSERKFCEEIGREAWGYIDCFKSIGEDILQRYDMISGNQKRWWCVTTTFDDRGKVRSAITETRDAIKKPDAWSSSTRYLDIYKDWFGSQEEAENWVKEALEA